MKMKRVYLDNSATTKVDDEVVNAMLPCFTEKYGNASSLYTLGREAHEVHRGRPPAGCRGHRSQPRGSHLYLGRHGIG